MWGEKSEPVIQFSHFFFSLGSAVIPFIMKPFLNEARSRTEDQNFTVNGEFLDFVGLFGGGKLNSQTFDVFR